jgi:hypothetical protein
MHNPELSYNQAFPKHLKFPIPVFIPEKRLFQKVFSCIVKLKMDSNTIFFITQTRFTNFTHASASMMNKGRQRISFPESYFLEKMTLCLSTFVC